MGANDGQIVGLSLLLGDGNVGKRFNIVVVAEGYRSEELPNFASDADAVLAKLTTSPPFASSIGALNVFRLDVASKMSGADQGTNLVDTYFDASFDASMPRLLLVDEKLVESTVSAAITTSSGAAAPNHKIIVLVNTPQDGGSGGTTNGIAVCASGPSSDGDVYERTVLHELGHTFGMADEYPNETASLFVFKKKSGATTTTDIMPNLSRTYVKDSLPQPWQSLVNTTVLPTVRAAGAPPLPEDTVGAFPVDDTGYYVPQWKCTMQDSRDAYCVVCATCIGSQIATFK